MPINMACAQAQNGPPPANPPPQELLNELNNCLERKNDTALLHVDEVYDNGKLKFRIDGFSSEATGIFVIRLRSSAPAFNRVLRNPSVDFRLRDTDLCLGIEVSLNCVYRYYHDVDEYFECTFSQF
jgi:hypothetical protein